MAKYPVYVVRDKLKGFNPQMLIDINEQSAVRGFSYQINTDKFYNYSPADYDLYSIGEFDTESGEFSSKLPEFIVNGVSVLDEK